MENPKVFVVKAAQPPSSPNGASERSSLSLAEESATGAFDPFGPDETQPLEGRSVFEPKEILRYVRERGYGINDDLSQRPVETPRSKGERVVDALSKAKSVLPRRKKPTINDDIELYSSLETAVSEGKTRKALKLADKHKLVGGELLVANTLHDLPYSRRVERYLRKIENGAPDYLADLVGTYANKNPRRKGPEYTILEPTVSAPPEQVTVGTITNQDVTEARDNTQVGSVLRFPEPGRGESSRPTVARRVLVAAAAVAALFGSMNALRGGGGEEGPQSAAFPPAPAMAPPTTLPPAGEGAPIVVDVPAESEGEDLETDLVSHVEPAAPTSTTLPAPDQQPPAPIVNEDLEPEQPVQPPVVEVPDDEPEPTPDPEPEPEPEPEPQPEPEPEPDPEPPEPPVEPPIEPPVEEPPTTLPTIPVPPVDAGTELPIQP